MTTPVTEIDRGLKSARREQDPLRRAVLIQDALARIDKLRKEVADERGPAVTEAHEEGYSYSAIADELGVSKPLVQQIVAKTK